MRVLRKMDDLWPGVAAVCLGPVCITLSVWWMLLMFLLRYDEGKGTFEALLMLPLVRHCNYRLPLHFAGAGSSSKHRDNDDSSTFAALRYPSLSKAKFKPAKLMGCFFCILCVTVKLLCHCAKLYCCTTIFCC